MAEKKAARTMQARLQILVVHSSKIKRGVSFNAQIIMHMETTVPTPTRLRPPPLAPSVEIASVVRWVVINAETVARPILTEKFFLPTCLAVVHELLNHDDCGPWAIACIIQPRRQLAIVYVSTELTFQIALDVTRQIRKRKRASR